MKDLTADMYFASQISYGEQKKKYSAAGILLCLYKNDCTFHASKQK